MKKNILLFIILNIVYFVVPLKSDALLCTSGSFNELKREAYKVQLTWELKFDEGNNSYFEVTVANMNQNILLNFVDVVYEGDENGTPFQISVPLEGGNTYDFKFYGGYFHPCTEEYIYTKTLEIPKYNKYSQYDECIEYEEWPLCNKWYSGEIISEEYFYERLEAYKKTLEIEEPPVGIEEEKTTIEKIIEFYIDNMIITIPATIVLVGGIASLIVAKIVRNKRRTKIDFGV